MVIVGSSLRRISKLARFIAVVCIATSTQLAMGADSFQGSVWTLTNGGLQSDSDTANQTYRITLGVDLAGYNGGGSFLDQVAIKVSDSVVGALLFAAPGGASEWQIVDGGINASGCSGSGGGFECANSVSLSNAGRGVAVGNPSVGIDYFWTFDLKMANGSLFQGSETPSIKARFIDGIQTCGKNGCDYGKVGALVSEHVAFTTPVPEPEISAMLGLGLGMMGWVGRRQKKLRERTS